MQHDIIQLSNHFLTCALSDSCSSESWLAGPCSVSCTHYLYWVRFAAKAAIELIMLAEGCTMQLLSWNFCGSGTKAKCRQSPSPQRGVRPPPAASRLFWGWVLAPAAFMPVFDPAASDIFWAGWDSSCNEVIPFPPRVLCCPGGQLDPSGPGNGLFLPRAVNSLHTKVPWCYKGKQTKNYSSKCRVWLRVTAAADFIY